MDVMNVFETASPSSSAASETHTETSVNTTVEAAS